MCNNQSKHINFISWLIYLRTLITIKFNKSEIKIHAMHLQRYVSALSCYAKKVAKNVNILRTDTILRDLDTPKAAKTNIL